MASITLRILHVVISRNSSVWRSAEGWPLPKGSTRGVPLSTACPSGRKEACSCGCGVPTLALPVTGPRPNSLDHVSQMRRPEAPGGKECPQDREPVPEPAGPQLWAPSPSSPEDRLTLKGQRPKEGQDVEGCSAFKGWDDSASHSPAGKAKPVPLPKSVYGCTADSMGLDVGWALDGTTWLQRETLQPALCLSSPNAGASFPTWCPEGAWSFPSWRRPSGRAVSRGWAVSRGVSSGLHLPQPLKCVRTSAFKALLPALQLPPRLFRVILREGWGGPRVGEGQRRQSCVCVREVHSSGTLVTA